MGSDLATADTTALPTRKRKATGSQGSLPQPDKKIKSEEGTKDGVPNAALLATPQTNPSTPKAAMDSEDEYMSVVSSQGFPEDEDQDSDGSLGTSLDAFS